MDTATTSATQAMGLVEFWDALNRHDWYRGFSGRTSSAPQVDVCRLATASPVHRSLFEAFLDHAHSPLIQVPPYDKRELPRPARPVRQDGAEWVATVLAVELGRFATEAEARERIESIVVASILDAKDVRHEVP